MAAPPLAALILSSAAVPVSEPAAVQPATTAATTTIAVAVPSDAPSDLPVAELPVVAPTSPMAATGETPIAKTAMGPPPSAPQTQPSTEPLTIVLLANGVTWGSVLLDLGADATLVLSIQVLRFVLVLVMSPFIARGIPSRTRLSGLS